MISIYTTAFNIEKNQFDINSAIENFCQLADEVCIATIPDSDDDTHSILENISKNNNKVKIFTSNDIDSGTFAKDGKLKNLALSNCSNEICIQLDCDERINDPNIWKNFIKVNKEIILDGYAFMVPVINLYKNKDHYKDISAKWYIHKRKNMYRGIVNFARRPDGRFDKDKSDGCELIDELGNLSKSINIAYHPDFRNKSPIDILKTPQIPFVIHYGYQDLERRAEINKNFWQKEWSEYSNKDIVLSTSLSEFKDEYFKHGLDI
jgi:hypothetical protein